jgi:hypothetical protein
MNGILNMEPEKRRSMWSALEENKDEAQPIEPQAPQSVLSQLRIAGEKQRSRDWEKKAANRTISYRGVPPDLQKAIKQIAASLHVLVDDVARAFLEFGLQCHRNSKLTIVAVLQEERLTLFPVNGVWSRPRFPGWIERSWDGPGPKLPGSSRISSDSWLTKPWKWPVVSYRRLPPELTAAIQELHVTHQVPVGEVVTLFLTYALAAYEGGRLVLFPQRQEQDGSKDA